MDFDSMTWEQVESMDDYVFFLSDNTQLSCLASDLGLSKGYVYYTQDEEMSMYKYDLEDESILLSLPCPNLPAPWYMPEWLMISATPRFGESTRTTDHVSEKNGCIHKVIAAMENQTVDKEDDKDDVKEAGPWMMLKDDHMVWLISNYLHTLDYIHLRGVSKKYHTMLDLRRSSSTMTVQTIDLSPWLVFPKHRAVFDFINPMHNNENYLMNIPELLKGSRIRFSKGGWLLLSKGKTLFFYNPFTRSTVKLPVLPDLCPQYAFTGISFSSLPTTSDCVVFAINKSSRDAVEISFIKRGDEFWTRDVYSNVYLPPRRKNVDFELNFNNPVFHRGAFYCLDLNGTLGVFNLEHDISWEILAMINPPNCDFIYKSFLVECDGKLVSVLLGHLGKWVRIFRLNDVEMVWVEVKHLGRHMLCISNTSCTSAMAPTGRMENKIFFPRLHNDEIVYYSLDTGMYHSLGSKHCAKDYRDSKENLNCSWIEPNWSETPDRYLNWLKI
ncbi:F-box/kelch-repeat protein At1g57790-like isoform X2 [Papaver somniferum]|nr:F-box/kelch-repeat protein At1g57790-like isoform X2 [Papaver somniferum]